MLVALIIAGWAGAVIVRRTLQPLARVAATATRVSELKLDRGEVDLAQRVPEADTDARTEVGQVGAALNRMLDHVGNALEARHASEMQVRQFVADASHELRTPLAAIRGYAELSRRSRQPVPEEVGHVLRRVESEAKRMTALVEDLLLLARLDAGRPLAHDPVDLTMLVVDAVSDAHAAGPRHDWQLDLPEEPVLVTGDQARLHQVLANLLANARTHTPEGTTVTVGVSATGTEAVLRVTDAGPGIPAELQPHIFERFARGDSSRSRAAGSTGLGLSIVHAVVTAHGGTVSVESAPGRTEFTVRLPLVPGRAGGSPAGRMPSISTSRRSSSSARAASPSLTCNSSGTDSRSRPTITSSAQSARPASSLVTRGRAAAARRSSSHGLPYAPGSPAAITAMAVMRLGRRDLVEQDRRRFPDPENHGGDRQVPLPRRQLHQAVEQVRGARVVHAFIATQQLAHSHTPGDGPDRTRSARLTRVSRAHRFSGFTRPAQPVPRP